MAKVDLVDRDPHNINDFIKVQFEDVLAEPEGARSIDCVWKLSYTCFNLWLNICYKLNTLLCGICIAAEWGCEFAVVAFNHIWFCTPALRLLEIECGQAKKCMKMMLSCFLEPCCEACGKVFVAFKK